ncbi:MAG: sulfatase-like hydrolase/transferase, partial [Verrucomicrobiota bacterium]
MNGFRFALLLTALLLVAAAPCPGKPNFIVILSDDMSYNGTSAFGGWIKTPHMERMATEGMKFTDFHSNGTVCSPTRAAFLTGRYQQRAGLSGVVYADPSQRAHYTGLQDLERTLPEYLKEAGYETGLLGKWHLGYHPPYNPTRHGFDRFRGFVSGNIDFISHRDNQNRHDWWHDRELKRMKGYVTHLINDDAVDFIEENREKPFFLYVAHEAVHSPFQGPKSKAQRGPEKGLPEDGVTLTKEEAFVHLGHHLH